MLNSCTALVQPVYATQVYLALSPNDYSPTDSLSQYTNEINSWMCQNFLQLNNEKEVIAFGNKDEALKVNVDLDSRGQTTKNQVKNLGLILETDLTFSSHVKAVTKSAYYHLKNIARIRCFVLQSRLGETCSCLYQKYIFLNLIRSSKCERP